GTAPKIFNDLVNRICFLASLAAIWIRWSIVTPPIKKFVVMMLTLLMVKVANALITASSYTVSVVGKPIKVCQLLLVASKPVCVVLHIMTTGLKKSVAA